MRFSPIYIASYLIVSECAFSFFSIMGLISRLGQLGFIYFPLAIWLAMILVNFYTMRISRNFTFFFYHSGHWKKMMSDYLQPRDLENDPPPDFKKLKVFLMLSAVLSGLITLLMLVAVASMFDEKSGGIVAAVGLLALRGGQAFYLYWTWRGIKFVSTYKDVDPGIIL